MTPENDLPVVAVIPNYNMAEYLEVLLPQLLAQDYDRVYVLDDHSTDNSRQVCEQFDAHDVVFVAGHANAGAGANRNRVLTELKEQTIIHFIDADMDLLTKNPCATIRKIMPADGSIGFIGGLIVDQ